MNNWLWFSGMTFKHLFNQRITRNIIFLNFFFYYFISITTNLSVNYHIFLKNFVSNLRVNWTQKMVFFLLKIINSCRIFGKMILVFKKRNIILFDIHQSIWSTWGFLYISSDLIFSHLFSINIKSIPIISITPITPIMPTNRISPMNKNIH